MTLGARPTVSLLFAIFLGRLVICVPHQRPPRLIHRQPDHRSALAQRRRYEAHEHLWLPISLLRGVHDFTFPPHIAPEPIDDRSKWPCLALRRWLHEVVGIGRTHHIYGLVDLIAPSCIDDTTYIHMSQLLHASVFSLSPEPLFSLSSLLISDGALVIDGRTKRQNRDMHVRG